MSEGTTKPSGSREMRVENEKIKKIEKRIKDAGHEWTFNAIEARFLDEMVKYFHDQKSDEYFNSPEAKAELEAAKKAGAGNNSSNTSSSGGGVKKAGDYTLAPKKVQEKFSNKIPDIAAGPEAKLKGKSKNKKEHEDRHEEK